MISGPTFRQDIKRAKSGGYRTHSSNAIGSNIDYANETTPLLGVGNTQSQSYYIPLWLFNWINAIIKVLETSTVHLLLPLLPFSLMARPLGWPPVTQFVLSFLSIIPLCSLIEFVTEEISMKLGMTLGGLMSATFGNTVEIVVSIIALKQNEIQLLKASLLGYILSNNLFIVGCCFMIGGFQHREQYFNMSVISTMSFIMAVSAIIMAVPTTIHFIVEHFGLSKGVSDNTPLAHGCALILLLIYSAFLAFQLRTHTDLFDDENCEADANEEENDPVLPIWASIITLIICIVLVTLCAQTLILNIGTIVEMTHSSKTFVGFVIIPFLSNTVTTFTAVSVALLDKMDLAISVTIGSSLQMLLFVAPLLVVISWIIGRDLTLSFGILEAVLLLLSSFVAILILQKGRSTYLDGVLCLGLYIVIVMTMSVYASDSMV